MSPLCASIPPEILDFVEIKSRVDVARCKAVCVLCPVRSECALAGRFELFGVWGGQARGEVVRFSGVRPITHNTRNGASAHRRRGEVPCDDCRAAENAYLRKQRGSR